MAAPADDTGTEKESIFDQLTGTQKSAILMMLIGEDEASEILRNLSPREVQHLGTAMYSVQGLDQETVNLVLDEFCRSKIFSKENLLIILFNFKR